VVQPPDAVHLQPAAVVSQRHGSFHAVCFLSDGAEQTNSAPMSEASGVVGVQQVDEGSKALAADVMLGSSTAKSQHTATSNSPSV
jgi:hypothetical protein